MEAVAQAAAALRRFHNNGELACQWLLTAGGLGDDEEQVAAAEQEDAQEDAEADNHGDHPPLSTPCDKGPYSQFGVRVRIDYGSIEKELDGHVCG